MAFADTRLLRRFSNDKMQKVGIFETAHMFCDVYCIRPGQGQPVHGHPGATKFYYVIEGEGTFTVGDDRRVEGPGTVVWAVPDEPHGVVNESRSDLLLLVAMAPNPNV